MKDRESALNAAIQEILSTDSISIARRVVAQTMIEKVETTLWNIQDSHTTIVPRSEAARSVYEKIASRWLPETSEAAHEEALLRREAYLSIVAFRGYELQVGEATFPKPATLAYLPKDIHCEEIAITNLLRETYGDSPPPLDLA